MSAVLFLAVICLHLPGTLLLWWLLRAMAREDGSDGGGGGGGGGPSHARAPAHRAMPARRDVRGTAPRRPDRGRRSRTPVPSEPSRPARPERRGAARGAARGRRVGLRVPATVGERPVLAQVAPGDLLAALPEHPPRQGEPLDAIMADVDRLILPGITHWNHPAFFAYFGITGSGPGIVGELIVRGAERQRDAVAHLARGHRAGGAHAGLGAASCSGLPDWLVRPDHRHGVELDAVGARRRPRGGRAWTSAAAGWPAATTCRRCGCTPPPRRTRPSRRPASRSGWGSRACTRSRWTASSGCAPIALARGRRGGRRGRACGRSPWCRRWARPRPPASTRCAEVADDLPRATACGCTSTRRTAGRRDCCPTHRHLLDGCERADSLVVNPHKWLLTPVDCSLLYTSRPGRAAAGLLGRARST